MTEQIKPTGFYVGNWGTWGWIETGIKGVGIAAGLLALVDSLPLGDLIIDGNPELGAVVIAAGLAFGYVFALGFRVYQREIISIVFGLFNVFGQFGVLLSLLTQPSKTTLPLIFGVFFVLGELAKQRFLQSTGYTEGGLSTPMILNAVRFMTAVYAAFVVFLAI